MKSSAHNSSSFLGSRHSHRASERRRVPFAHPCTFLGSIVACTRAAFQPPPPPEWPEHVPGGGATVLLSAAQCATFSMDIAAHTALALTTAFTRAIAVIRPIAIAVVRAIPVASAGGR